MGNENPIQSINERKKDFECSICDAKLISKRGLNNHIEFFHEGKKNFECRGRQRGGGRGGGCPPSFSRFSPIFLEIHPKNGQNQIIFNVLPPSFREVVTPLW